jgi:hypothetical protein
MIILLRLWIKQNDLYDPHILLISHKQDHYHLTNAHKYEYLLQQLKAEKNDIKTKIII